MILSGITDGDSNQAIKWYNRGECMITDSIAQMGPILGFRPRDLEGVAISHNDALVIKATIVNFEVA